MLLPEAHDVPLHFLIAHLLDVLDLLGELGHGGAGETVRFGNREKALLLTERGVQRGRRTVRQSVFSRHGINDLAFIMPAMHSFS